MNFRVIVLSMIIMFIYNNVGTADGVIAHTAVPVLRVLHVRHQISVSVAAALVSEKVQEVLWIHY